MLVSCLGAFLDFLLTGLEAGASSSLSECARPLFEFGLGVAVEDLILALALVGAVAAFATVAFFRGGILRVKSSLLTENTNYLYQFVVFDAVPNWNLFREGRADAIQLG